MKKLYFALPFVLLSVSGANAKLCFEPYDVQIQNISGGEAELEKSKNISGMRRNQIIANDGSMTITIEKPEAYTQFEFGPEGQESKKTIDYHAKSFGHSPTVTLGKSGNIQLFGFDSKGDEQYDVVIVNESGGNANILKTCGISFNGTLPNESSQQIKVQSGSQMIFEMGPRKHKNLYTITFGSRISNNGSNRRLVLQQRTWFAPPVKAHNVSFATSADRSKVVPIFAFGRKLLKKRTGCGSVEKTKKAVKSKKTNAPRKARRNHK